LIPPSAVFLKGVVKKKFSYFSPREHRVITFKQVIAYILSISPNTFERNKL